VIRSKTTITKFSLEEKNSKNIEEEDIRGNDEEKQRGENIEKNMIIK
jgi:hypothetical protein